MEIKLVSYGAILSVLITTAIQLPAAVFAASPKESSGHSLLAATPPMGWNSWDGYGTTINETQFKANADWLARNLKPFGWQYVVVDMEWFVMNPVAEGNSKTFQYNMDRFGRYIPPVTRFPSAANDAGFKPLAAYVHSLGLKFGIHILRGIPKQGVAGNLPIEGSTYHASDVADFSDTCPWNSDNYGIDSSKPGAQAYYDSIAQLYASWDVDFVKADCISSGPYKGEEIRLLSRAFEKTGRPIVLSLSPGPAPLEKADEMRKYAQMWRISGDIWDVWHNHKDYPQGVRDQFERAAKWAPLSEPGHWPDADMLPVGHLGPAPGWDPPRDTRLTHDEQRTLLTLWCMFRSPLMVGGDLTAGNPWTTSLLTNPEVIEIDQHSTENHPIITTDSTVIWSATPASGKGRYIAVFNLRDSVAQIHYAWADIGLPEKTYVLRDLWNHEDLKSAKSLRIDLPAHGSALYRISTNSNGR